MLNHGILANGSLFAVLSGSEYAFAVRPEKFLYWKTTYWLVDIFLKLNQCGMWGVGISI